MYTILQCTWSATSAHDWNLKIVSWLCCHLYWQIMMYVIIRYMFYALSQIHFWTLPIILFPKLFTTSHLYWSTRLFIHWRCTNVNTTLWRKKNNPYWATVALFLINAVKKPAGPDRLDNTFTAAEIWSAVITMYVGINLVSARLSIGYFNSLPAKISYLNFHLLEVVGRYRDPQLQVGENYSYLFRFRPNVCMIIKHLKPHNCDLTC